MIEVFARQVTLVTDNGPQFTNEEFKDFVERAGADHLTTASYHPNSNG
jgi:transposase InsO family protein